jgi:osmoprotectant transport system permease protein
MMAGVMGNVFLVGWFDGVTAFINEYGADMLDATQRHLILTVGAMAIACSLAIPIGIILARSRFRTLSQGIMGLAGMIQTIPSLALIALIVALLLWFNDWTGSLGATWRFSVIGLGPGLTVLVAYALLPVLRNTFTGVRQVDESVIDVARGMGMTSRQILWKVQLPLAVPIIMAGIRISTVWTIGIATLVTFIGAGGLGDLIYSGLTTRRTELLMAGVLPAVVMAVVLDWTLGLIEKLLTPQGAESSTKG